ncbi:MAG: hypothetical protein OJF47_003945 [Nitrospira sp.]|nr:MAG: hypothetical protein OJF47_003945 [Nitrospira sp.]
MNLLISVRPSTQNRFAFLEMETTTQLPQFLDKLSPHR